VATDTTTKLLQNAEKYVLDGKIPQAIAEYSKVLDLNPRNVLVLTTIGHLYLRLHNISEANKYLIQVAEGYDRNKFFLKAIAVYKQILNADANNLGINLALASLYAKQGLSIDSLNQYLRVATLLEQHGKNKELMSVYEKIAELDPSNSEAKRKLAELHLEV